MSFAVFQSFTSFVQQKQNIMKQTLLSLLALGFVTVASAQIAIPNGGLETWNTTTMNEPQFYFTANQEVSFGQFANWPTTQTTDAQLNTYAVRMETQDNGTDTMFGYFSNGDPGNGEGGIPYAVRPTALTGYWKGTIMPGDTGLIMVMFKYGGSVISFDLYQFYGTAGTYTAFTLPINLPPIVTPDSVIVAGVSSNAFVFPGIPGSNLQIDNLVFTGAASQPTMLNGDFENWNTTNYVSIVDWMLAGDSALQTTDAYAGQYAVELQNFTYGPGNYSPSYLTNGYWVQNGPPMGGFPYNGQIDTLKAYYKFSGGVGDTAFLLAVFTGPNVGDTAYVFDMCFTAATYTLISIPFNLPFVPDSVAITAASDIQNPSSAANNGNTLIIDEIQLASQALTTGIPITWQNVSNVLVYPNPNNGQFTIDAKDGYSTIVITDVTGRVVYSENNEVAVAGRKEINLSEFGAGTYFVNVTSGAKVTTRKVVVQ